MKCPDPVQLESYVDGELPADAAAAVVRHLAVCPSCADRVEQTRRLVALLRRTSAGQQHELDVHGLIAAVKRQAGQRAVKRQAGQRRLLATHALARSVAAAVVLLVLGVGVLTYQSGQSVPPAGGTGQFAQVLLREHQAYAVVLAADPELNVQVASAGGQ